MKKEAFLNLFDRGIEWSIYLMVLLLPFSKSVLEISVTAACVFWVLRKIIARDFTLKHTPLNGLLAILFIAYSISLIHTDYRVLVIRSLVTKYIKYAVFYLVVVESIDSQIKLKNILKLAVISAVIVMIDSFLQYYWSSVDLIRLYPAFKFNINYRDAKGFPTGPFPFPNDLSSWIIVLILPSFHLAMWGLAHWRSRVLGAVFTGSLLFLLYLANTRSAWLGFAAALFCTFFLEYRQKIIKTFLVVILIVLIIIPLLPKQRVRDIFGFRSMKDRTYMWKTGWDAFMQHPVIGSGYNTFFLEFKKLREDQYKGKKGSYAHNAYLQIAADSGIVGLAAFLAFIATALRTMLAYARTAKTHFYKSFAIGIAGGLVAFLIHAFFDTNLQSLPLVTLFWLALSIGMSLPSLEERTALARRPDEPLTTYGR